MITGFMRGLAAVSISCLAVAGAAAAPGEGAAQAKKAAAPAAAERSLFAIVYSAGPKWKPGVLMRDQGLLEHFYYVKGLHEAGKIFSGGALGPDGGLILLHAHDIAEVEAIIAADPAVRDGIFLGEARAYATRFLVDYPLTAKKP